MKINYNIKKALQACSLLFIMIIGTNAYAQVGIGNTNPAAALDITSTNEGLLIPRVALIDRNTSGPITNPTDSELIYNTATASVGTAAEVTPGYYYWNQITSSWIRLTTGTNMTSGWSLTGNAGITGSNFLGTTDTQDLAFRTGNMERMRVSGTTGNIGIGATVPSEKFEIASGNIFMNNNATTGNWIRWNSVGLLGPTFSTRSQGTRLVLWPGIVPGGDNLTADYAIGMEGGAIWYGVPKADNVHSHKFYGGTSSLMMIRGDGNVGIGTTVPAQKLTVAGGNIGLDNQGIIVAKNSGGITYENVLYGRWVNDATYLDGGIGGTYLRTNNGTVENQFLSINGNVGIGSSTPQKKLHVNGSLQVTNELNLGGDASTAGTAGTTGQYLKSNGPGVAPTWENLANVVPGSNGTVIAVNGQFLIAQEMVVQMSADYPVTVNSQATPIGNLNVEIIDNENRYTGNATSNSFTVSATGVYQVAMNMQISGTLRENLVIGIWDDIAANWIARINDQHIATTSGFNENGTALNPFQTQTLITSVNMVAGRTYSFRIACFPVFTVKAFSSGSTGIGPVSQVSLKRLR